ncbi:hypothetical protein BT63DRAFT_460340 [Microthyrium microscopicum]|uniref:Uncharacterized protein n=1 Tax=Microthyrium microscopicum TaxID=703497 RepID=A0A6A6TVD7_9PEZI|nr:hypothetical protein BT63DRAFT_460340 [Microthyrium microscopicum]
MHFIIIPTLISCVVALPQSPVALSPSVPKTPTITTPIAKTNTIPRNKSIPESEDSWPSLSSALAQATPNAQGTKCVSINNGNGRMCIIDNGVTGGSGVHEGHN